MRTLADLRSETFDLGMTNVEAGQYIQDELESMEICAAECEVQEMQAECADSEEE